MTPSDAISALIDKGMTEPAIARLVGVSQATINRIRRGGTKSPRYEVGQRLIELAKKKGRPNA